VRAGVLMRAIFIAYLVVIFLGIGFYSVIGLLGH
jgi:hypothetical protein